MRLSSREKETIVNFNEDEEVACVYTCNRAWMNHLAALGLQAMAVHMDKGKVYAKEYQLPKEWVRKPTKSRSLSPQERERLKRHMARVNEAAGAR